MNGHADQPPAPPADERSPAPRADGPPAAAPPARALPPDEPPADAGAAAVEHGLTIKSAGLLLTYWCNARCAHCYELAGPRREGWMELADATAHLGALADLGIAVDGLHLGGGEPFGDFELLLAVVEAAARTRLGGVGYVETNGFWATDDELVRRRLAALRDAGMRRISLSADVFHQTFVPPERIARLWRMAREMLGKGGVRARRWRFLQAPRDLASLTIEERQAAYRDHLARYGERLNGRAAHELADLLPRRPAAEFADLNCRKELLQSGHVHLDRHGHVFPGTCAGLILGRTGEATGEQTGRRAGELNTEPTATSPAPRTLAEILRAQRGPIWRALVAHGPCGLRPLAESHGFRDPPSGYAAKCHLCYALRTHLFTAGRCHGELGPAEAYIDIK